MLLCGSYRCGLSEEEIEDILSTDNQVMDSVLQFHQPPIKRIPPNVLAGLWRDLGHYVVRRGEYGKTVCVWYRKQFKDISQMRYHENSAAGESGMSITTSAEFISEYFSGESKEKFPTRGLTSHPLSWIDEDNDITYNVSKLSELPHALSMAEQHTGNGKAAATFVKTICRTEFTFAKRRTGLDSDIIQDFRNMLKVVDNSIAKTSNQIESNEVDSGQNSGQKNRTIVLEESKAAILDFYEKNVKPGGDKNM